MAISSPYREGSLIKNFFCLALLLGLASQVYAQAHATAEKTADVQVGATYSYVKSDYTSDAWHGYGFYADVDFRYHLGVEFAFHQSKGSDPVLYERTYELGLRYVQPIHNDRFLPYAKGMIGRGVFNFAGVNGLGQSVQVANLAYNTQSVGAGMDWRVLPGLNVRVIDYEYHFWNGFPPHGLNPNLFSFGVAYHFHGNMSK